MMKIKTDTPLFAMAWHILVNNRILFDHLIRKICKDENIFPVPKGRNKRRLKNKIKKYKIQVEQFKTCAKTMRKNLTITDDNSLILNKLQENALLLMIMYTIMGEPKFKKILVRGNNDKTI